MKELTNKNKTSIGGFQNYTQFDNSLDLCDILCSIYLFIVFTKIFNCFEIEAMYL